MMANIWGWGNFIGICACSIIVAFSFTRKIGYVGSALWAWVLISAIRTFLYPQENMNWFLLQIVGTTGQAYALALAAPLAVILIHRRIFRHWRKFVTALVLLDLILIPIYGYGIHNAISFDTGFLAAMIPVVPSWVAVIILGYCLKYRGATAFLVLAALVMGYLKFTKRRVFVAPLLLVVFLAAFYTQGDKIFNDSERLQTWYRSLMFIWTSGNWLQGSGIGTFQWLGPVLQRLKGDLFLQMHNDWLQVFFESGVVGSVLMLVLYCQLLWRSQDSKRVFLGLIGLGTLAITYHPLRFFPGMIVTLIVCREALESIPKKYRIGSTI